MRCYLLRVGTCGQPDGIHVELMLSLSTSHCMCVPVCASSLSPVATWDAVSLTVMQHGHKTWNIQVPASSSFDLHSHHFPSASCGRNKKSAVCLIGNRISLWARQPRQEITVNPTATAARHRSGPFISFRLHLFQMLKTKETEAKWWIWVGEFKVHQLCKPWLIE